MMSYSEMWQSYAMIFLWDEEARKSWSMGTASSRTSRFIKQDKRPHVPVEWRVEWTQVWGFSRTIDDYHKLTAERKPSITRAVADKCDLIRVRKPWVHITDKTLPLFLKSMGEA